MAKYLKPISIMCYAVLLLVCINKPTNASRRTKLISMYRHICNTKYCPALTWTRGNGCLALSMLPGQKYHRKTCARCVMSFCPRRRNLHIFRFRRSISDRR